MDHLRLIALLCKPCAEQVFGAGHDWLGIERSKAANPPDDAGCWMCGDKPAVLYPFTRPVTTTDDSVYVDAEKPDVRYVAYLGTGRETGSGWTIFSNTLMGSFPEEEDDD